jgi:hypothetical protein
MIIILNLILLIFKMELLLITHKLFKLQQLYYTVLYFLVIYNLIKIILKTIIIILIQL